MSVMELLKQLSGSGMGPIVGVGEGGGFAEKLAVRKEAEACLRCYEDMRHRVVLRRTWSA